MNSFLFQLFFIIVNLTKYPKKLWFTRCRFFEISVLLENFNLTLKNFLQTYCPPQKKKFIALSTLCNIKIFLIAAAICALKNFTLFLFFKLKESRQKILSSVDPPELYFNCFFFHRSLLFAPIQSKSAFVFCLLCLQRGLNKDSVLKN